MKSKMMKLTVLSVAALLTLSACSSSAAPTPAPDTGGGDGPATAEQEPVTLTVVSAHSQGDVLGDGFEMWVEHVKEEAPWVTIDYKGSTEVMPVDQLFEGVSSGAIDMAAVAAAQYSATIPLANAMKFTPFTPDVERTNGALDIIQAAHEAAGAHYLGRTISGIQFKLYFKDQISSPDFSGLSMRTSPVYKEMLQALGAAPVSMPPPEIYSAMERGVVNGFGWPALGVIDNSWQEVTNYELATPFYSVEDGIIINKKRWDSLSPETQEALTRAMEKTEAEVFDHYSGLAEAEQQQRADAGVKLIEFSASDEEYFLKTAYDAGWDAVLSSTPEAQKLRDIYGN